MALFFLRAFLFLANLCFYTLRKVVNATIRALHNNFLSLNKLFSKNVQNVFILVMKGQIKSREKIQLFDCS